MRVLVTGSSGLIGSEAVVFFDAMGFAVTGVDHNMRADFFGPKSDTTWNRQRLERVCSNFTHTTLDIRDRSAVNSLFSSNEFDLIIHAAAQPSHDLAASRPFDDFDINAVGTLNLLEACRQNSADAVFIHMSTNKVYGDGQGNAASVIECVAMIHERTGKKPDLTYSETNRVGDHICYYSDLRNLNVISRSGGLNTRSTGSWMK